MGRQRDQLIERMERDDWLEGRGLERDETSGRFESTSKKDLDRQMEKDD